MVRRRHLGLILAWHVGVALASADASTEHTGYSTAHVALYPVIGCLIVSIALVLWTFRGKRPRGSQVLPISNTPATGNGGNTSQQSKEPEKLTLSKLARSAYHVVEQPVVAPASGATTEQLFIKDLQTVVLLGNLEVCMIRDIKCSRQQDPQAQGVNEDTLCDLDEYMRTCTSTVPQGGVAADMKDMVVDIIRTNNGGAGTKVSLRQLHSTILEKAKETASSALEQWDVTNGRPAADAWREATFRGVACIFAAYSPDALNASGSDMSPADDELLPSRYALRARASSHLVDLAKTLLDKVQMAWSPSEDAGPPYRYYDVLEMLLEAAVKSGQVELAEELLRRERLPSMLAEHQAAIINTFCYSLAGYVKCELRNSPKGLEQVDDWLDYKHSMDRAKRMASVLLNFAMWHGNAAQFGQVLGGGEDSEPFADLSNELCWQPIKKALCHEYWRPAACKPLADALLDKAARLKTKVEERRVEQGQQDVVNSVVGNLAVKACRMAIASNDLETVEDIVDFIRRNDVTWLAMDMKLLDRLAHLFPAQAVSLIRSIKLKPIGTNVFDNVLPFGLPPGSFAVAVSDKGTCKFGTESAINPGGRSVSTKDSKHFSKQKQTDPTIEATLMLRHSTWFAFLFMLWLPEWNNRTVRHMCRVVWSVAVVFLLQGPASFVVGVLLLFLFFVFLVLTRAPSLLYIFVLGLVNIVLALVFKLFGLCFGSKTGSRLTSQRRFDLTDSFFEPHHKMVDWVIGWGTRFSGISVRKVPVYVTYTRQDDTKLLKRLLRNSDVPVSVFGSQLLKPLIRFKWDYFTRYFVTMQFLLQLVYTIIFLVYAWSIKNMEAVEGREEHQGPGRLWSYKGSDRCELPAPTFRQFGYLIALGAITLDSAIQEIRQVFHFKLAYVWQPWDVLDICSVILMTLIIASHFVCAVGKLGVSPDQLRGMAAVQVLLLFIRLSYYCMAFERLGAFVRMVVSMLQNLAVFASFLIVVFLGFAMAIITAQGSMSDRSDEIKSVFTRLFTIIFGDIDSDFLTDPWAQDSPQPEDTYTPPSTDDQSTDTVPPLQWMISVFVVLFLIAVTIVLLNLLIAIISEAYDTVQKLARQEALRNKAMLIVSTEALMQMTLMHRWLPLPWFPWVYTPYAPNLVDRIYSWLASTPLAAPGQPPVRAHVYVIKSRDTAAGAADDSEEEEIGGRLGEIQKLLADETRRAMFGRGAADTNTAKDSLLNELKKLLPANGSPQQQHASISDVEVKKIASELAKLMREQQSVGASSAGTPVAANGAAPAPNRIPGVAVRKAQLPNNMQPRPQPVGQQQPQQQGQLPPPSQPPPPPPRPQPPTSTLPNR